MDYIISISKWLRPHLHHVSLAIVATLLVVYGNDLNAFIRRRIRRFHFLVRVTLFVLLCSAGYGAAVLYGGRLVAYLLAKMPNAWLAPTVVLLFIGVGYLAEEKRHI